MRPMIQRFSTVHTLFLEPPHSHDPVDISHVAAIPSDMLKNLPAPVQDALLRLQESTSVASASYNRLQEMLEDRFDRLVALGDARMSGAVQYSETAFFNYTNQISAEKQYLLKDALPEWRHKASRVNLDQYFDLQIEFLSQETTVAEWWSQLQDTVASWLSDANAIQIPDFEDTVAEYQNSQLSTPSSTPVREDEPEDPICVGIAVRDFGHEFKVLEDAEQA